MDRRTVEVYENRAGEWQSEKSRPIPASLAAFAQRVPAGTFRLDLGCGPGWHTAGLGPPAIASDAARPMLAVNEWLGYRPVGTQWSHVKTLS